MRRPDAAIRPSGQEMFMLADPTVRLLVQQLPNAEKCCPPYVMHNIAVRTQELVEERALKLANTRSQLSGVAGEKQKATSTPR